MNWHWLKKFLSFRASLANPDKWLVEAWGGRAVSSGMTVNATTALYVSAVYACVRVIAETIASLPLPVYRRGADGGKERAFGHYLYPVLHDQANPEMTALEFKETMMGHVLLRGNAFAEIERDGGGRVIALWPLHPDKVKVKRVEGQLLYEVRPNNGPVVPLPAFQVFHLRGLSSNGIIGYSPLEIAKETIGLAMGAEEYAARFFSNDATPGGVLQHPGKLGPDAYDQLKKSWAERHGGTTGAHKPAILEEGMTWKEIGIHPKDAQLIELRRFQVTDIARIFRVPPHLIGDLEKSTFSNIEHQGIEFVVHTIRPWAVRWEQAIRQRLIALTEQPIIFAEFLIDGLLRGDTASRYSAYAVGRQWGWLSADDVRALENMNPLPDGQGKIYMVPLNMVPAGTVGSMPVSEEKSLQEQREAWLSLRSVTARRRLGESFKPLFIEAVNRIIRRERADVMRAAEKFLGRGATVEFNEWLEEFYLAHPTFIERNMLPVLMAYGEAVAAEASQEVGGQTGRAEDGDKLTPELEDFIRAYQVAYTTRHIGSSLGQLRQIVKEAIEKGEDPVTALVKRFDEWEKKRPDKIANREIVQAGSAITLAVFAGAGITKIRWHTFGKNCPACNHLGGKVVGVIGGFVKKGEAFQPVGLDSPMTARTDIKHPPLHLGCNCGIGVG